MAAYKLFISRSWFFLNSYDSLIDLLNAYPRFYFESCEAPKDVLTTGSEQKLYDTIKQQMSLSQVIIIQAGAYDTYSSWIDREVQLAQQGFLYRKPILTIERLGIRETSTKVKNATDRIVKWDSDLIVGAIRELAD